MNWRDVVKKKREQADKIDKQIKVLESQREAIGDCCPLTVIAELISARYNQVCRIERNHLVLYDKTATKKQIRYKRHEVAHSIEIVWDFRQKEDSKVCYYAGIDSSRLPFDATQWLPLPNDIDDIYKLLTTEER